MAGGPEKPVFDYVQNKLQKPQELWDLLLAFMMVSARYGIEKKSMQVYWGVLANVLVRCEPYYILELEYRVRPEANDQWSTRFAALYVDWLNEAKTRIAKRRKEASYIDFRRLDRFIQREEDVKAAEKSKPAHRPASKNTKKFLEVFHAHMAKRTKPARLELDEVIQKLVGKALEDCYAAYLDASLGYAPNDTFSLYAFFGLASRAMYFTDRYFALKFDQWIKPETKSTSAARYAALDDFQLTSLGKDLAYAKNHTRILDELRFAYYQVHAKDPDDRDLRDFEAVKDDELSREASGILAQYDRYCEAHDLRGFASYWDSFAKLLEKKDRLTLAMAVKWCRDWLAGEREMRDEMYWNAVGVLLMKLLVDRPNEYQRGFNKEETAYFVSANNARQPYLDDFSRRMYYLWTTRNLDRFAKLGKVHAALMLYGAKRNMRLARMEETAVVYARLERIREQGPRKDDLLSIPVTQPEGLLKDRNAMVSIGETYGDLAIVGFDGLDTAYLECRGIEKVLFVMQETVYAHQLGQLTQARFYDELWEGTQHLLTLIPIFFEVLSYIPDLVSGGLVGLAKSVALQYVIDKGTQAVLGDTAEQKFLASAISVGTGHLTQVDNAATRNISAELDAAHALERGSARGLALPEEGVKVDLGGGTVTTKPGLAGAVEEVATLDVHPLATERVLPYADLPPRPLSSYFELSPSTPIKLPESLHVEPPAVTHLEPPNLAEVEVPSTPRPRKDPGKREGSQSEVADEGPDTRILQSTKGRGSREKESSRGKGDRDEPEEDPRASRDRGTKDKGKPPPRPKPPKKTKPRYVTLWGFRFRRSWVQYQIAAPLEHFDAVRQTIATRFQVYEIKNARGETVYVGITGGRDAPRDALQRLQEHLYTKAGEFIGDAAYIIVRATDLDEHVARACEDALIDVANPHWNKRDRDPASYVRMYGEKPALKETLALLRLNLWFRIDVAP